MGGGDERRSGGGVERRSGEEEWRGGVERWSGEVEWRRGVETRSGDEESMARVRGVRAHQSYGQGQRSELAGRDRGYYARFAASSVHLCT